MDSGAIHSNHKKDDQGQLRYELHAVDGTVFQTYDEIMVKSHLYPRGAVILKGEEATCIGVLNFSDDEIKKISPVFFTPESLKGEVQLYYPSTGCPEGRTEVDSSLVDSVKSPQATSEASSSSAPVVSGYRNQRQMLSFTAQSTLNQNLATEHENRDEGSSSDGLTVSSQAASEASSSSAPVVSSYGNQHQILSSHENLAMEHENHHEGSPKDKHTMCSESDLTLQEKQKRDQEMISLLKERNAELRNDIKKTEQQNQELQTEIEELKDLRKENEDLRTENKKLRVENEGLRKERQTESKELREDNRQLRTENKELREGWRAESKELRAENKESREKWRAESNELRAENKELRSENEELRAENDELRAKNGEWPGKLKELLCEKDSAVKVFEEDTPSSEGSKDVNASGSSANNKQGDSDGSCKEEPFFDPVSEDVSKLD